MTTIIRDGDTLQDCVGQLPRPRDLKVLDFINSHARRRVASTFFAFARGAVGAGPHGQGSTA